MALGFQYNEQRVCEFVYHVCSHTSHEAHDQFLTGLFGFALSVDRIAAVSLSVQTNISYTSSLLECFFVIFSKQNSFGERKENPTRERRISLILLALE
jgi:hypothetical protein